MMNTEEGFIVKIMDDGNVEILGSRKDLPRTIVDPFTLTIPSLVHVYDNDGGLSSKAYSCTHVGSSAFVYEIEAVRTLVVSDAIVSIGDYAFYGNSFEIVSIPNTVRHFGKGALKRAGSSSELSPQIFGFGMPTIPTDALK